ncbi:hypothetical protein EDD22DRAFT_852821 [Suillus occidentalis]|nr:hypothetical protein EDD22DRAFT_852821 [Suillus occidentalis]
MTLCNSSLRSCPSPNITNAELYALPLGIEQDEQSKPAEVKESLFSRHGKRSRSLSPHKQFTRKKSSKTSFPYPVNPAPSELRYAARVMNLKFQPELSLEATKKLEEQLESGLSQMSTLTLYKGYKAKLATHEVARQCMLLTTWEIEEADRHSIFLNDIHAENEGQFKSAEQELQCYRKIFSQHGQAELGDDRKYLQAVYQDESDALRVISTQTDQVAKLLSMPNLMNLAMWMIWTLTQRVQAKVLNCQLHDNRSSIGVNVHDAGNLSIPAPWHMVSQQSMQPPDPDPRICDGVEDIARESIHDPYDRFRLGTSLNGSTGNSIQPLIPNSAQFDAFYPLPFPLSFAGSSQRSERHRRARPPSTMPYFIPRAVPPSEPTASSPMQPVIAAPAVLLAPVLPPEPMAMQPKIMPAAQVGPVASTFAPTTVLPVVQSAAPVTNLDGSLADGSKENRPSQRISSTSGSTFR